MTSSRPGSGQAASRAACCYAKGRVQKFKHLAMAPLAPLIPKPIDMQALLRSEKKRESHLRVIVILIHPIRKPPIRSHAFVDCITRLHGRAVSMHLQFPRHLI
jgi:hypothetical protein